MKIELNAPVSTINIAGKASLMGMEKKRAETDANADVGGGEGHVVVVKRESGDESIPADVVLVNADRPYATSTLLNNDADADDKLEYSAGILEFCWGVRDELQGMQQHNVFLSSDWEGSWTRPGSRHQLPRTGNFYVHIPSKTDATAATEQGTHSVMILFPVAHLGELVVGKCQEDAGKYDELEKWCKARILERFEAVLGYSIEEKIECESVTTPEGWRDAYNLQNGSAFGLSHGLNQLGFFRPGNKYKDTEGLYFVGASTHPGNGVPLVLTGSKLVCERILQDTML